MDMKTQIMQALARGYCSPQNEQKVLDPDLIEAMTKELLASFTPTRTWSKPWRGGWIDYDIYDGKCEMCGNDQKVRRVIDPFVREGIIDDGKYHIWCYECYDQRLMEVEGKV